jgi:biotin transporter BioY
LIEDDWEDETYKEVSESGICDDDILDLLDNDDEEICDMFEDLARAGRIYTILVALTAGFLIAFAGVSFCTLCFSLKSPSIGIWVIVRTILLCVGLIMHIGGLAGYLNMLDFDEDCDDVSTFEDSEPICAGSAQGYMIFSFVLMLIFTIYVILHSVLYTFLSDKCLKSTN